MPSPGEVSFLDVPGGPGVRVDGGIYQGYKIPPFYDLDGRLNSIVWAPTREVGREIELVWSFANIVWRASRPPYPSTDHSSTMTLSAPASTTRSYLEELLKEA